MSERTKQSVKSVRRPRLGFLGVGWIGRHRMESIAKSGVADVSAIADTVCDLAVSAAGLCPGAVALSSLEELLEADIDGVVIATPNALHAEQAIAALDRGLAVFCQKPLGRNAAETREIIEAARIADRLLAVDLSYRFTDGMRKIRELAGAGELGDIYAVNLVFHNAYGPDKAWFYDRKLSGGGCLIDLGIHLVDLALWTLDFPRVERVSSRLFAAGKPLRAASGAVEDYAAAQLELNGGAVAQLACSWKAQAGSDCIIEASFYGTRGGASFRNLNGSFYDFTAERFYGTARDTLSAPPDEWGGRAAIEWARRLAADNSFDPAVMRLVEVASTLDRIYEQG